ncbi:MAG: tetratricopeptide repeat protein [Pseudomonadota bacterium]
MTKLPILVLALGAALPALADFQDGVRAAQAGDYATALREWQPLAGGGHRDAQFNLGLLYENGLGVQRDAARAAQWYRRAAEQNDAVAAAYLAEMYAKGLGVGRDDAEALRWYRQAAERGHAASQYNVGLFYALGRGIAPSDVQALAWLTVALENGAAPTELPGLLRRNMSSASRREAARLADDVRRRCSLE